MKKFCSTATRTISFGLHGLYSHCMAIRRLMVMVVLLLSTVPAFAEGNKDLHELKIEAIGDSKVNVRKGPGTEYEVIGQLSPGEWMWVKGEPDLEKEWVMASKIGLTGYINTGYVRIVEESHAFESYKGLDFFPVPGFFPRLKVWAWNLIVFFFILLISLWILLRLSRSVAPFLCALSVACTACIIWYTNVLGRDAFWFADPQVSGGWLWTIGYGALFLILGFAYLYISALAIAESCEDLDEFGNWSWSVAGLCLYLIFAAVARWWVDWTIWLAYAALAAGVLVQAYKILTSAGIFPTLLFLFTCVGVYIIIEPLLYILAFAAIFCLVALAFLKGSTNTGTTCGSDQVQFEIVDEHGKSIIITCSKVAPSSGRGDDGNRYDQLPNGRWRKV
mgnify:CR=1 FL=1